VVCSERRDESDSKGEVAYFNLRIVHRLRMENRKVPWHTYRRRNAADEVESEHTAHEQESFDEPPALPEKNQRQAQEQHNYDCG
jgi:hypothetical protein